MEGSLRTIRRRHLDSGDIQRVIDGTQRLPEELKGAVPLKTCRRTFERPERSIEKTRTDHDAIRNDGHDLDTAISKHSRHILGICGNKRAANVRCWIGHRRTISHTGENALAYHQWNTDPEGHHA